MSGQKFMPNATNVCESSLQILCSLHINKMMMIPKPRWLKMTQDCVNDAERMEIDLHSHKFERITEALLELSLITTPYHLPSVNEHNNYKNLTQDKQAQPQNVPNIFSYDET